MSKLKGLLLVFLAFLVVSCQSKTSEAKPIEQKKVEVVEPNLKIEFKFKTNKPDIFRIMINGIEIDEIQKKNIHIIEEVTPSTSEDTILANFDKGNISSNILINLGNKEPKDVEIISVLVTYGEKHFNITSSEDLDKYLGFNKCIDRGTDGKTITTKRIDGVLNPVIYFRQSFINLLKKQ